MTCRSKSLPNRAVKIPLGPSKDIDIQFKDFNGKKMLADDIDLQLHLSPEQLISSALQQQHHRQQPENMKCRVKNMLSRLSGAGGSNNCQKFSNSTITSSSKNTGENVVYIKDKLTLKDSISGTEYDVEMDLKVEIENPNEICQLPVDNDSESQRNSNGDSSENDSSRRRSKSCGRGVRHVLADRLCRPLFGGSTSKLHESSSRTNRNDQRQSNDNSCASSCISAPWKRRLQRRKQLRNQQKEKDVLSRSKSLDLPRQKEKETYEGNYGFNYN